MIDVATLRARLPAFASTTKYPDDLVDASIQEALRWVSASFFGAARYDDAILYMSAHLLTLSSAASAGAASAGAVRSVTAGSASVTYNGSIGSNASNFPGLDSTTYGRRYRELVKLIGAARVLCD
jgi:hypothetical protein